jgi:hypothetical protein
MDPLDPQVSGAVWNNRIIQIQLKFILHTKKSDKTSYRIFGNSLKVSGPSGIALRSVSIFSLRIGHYGHKKSVILH